MSEQSFKREQVVEIIGSVVQRITHATPTDTVLLQKISALNEAIDGLRTELSQAHARQTQSIIPETSSDLDAIVETTEAATNSIMDACEKIQAGIEGADTAMHQAVENEIIHIYEACAFQDLTAQRIARIMKTLKEIDSQARTISDVLHERFGDIESVSETQGADAPVSLLNGPSLPGQGISQEEIDKLLNDMI